MTARRRGAGRRCLCRRVNHGNGARNRPTGAAELPRIPAAAAHRRPIAHASGADFLKY
jgi:hypothetical protein